MNQFKKPSFTFPLALAALLAAATCPVSLAADHSKCDDDATYAEVSKDQLKELVSQKAVFVVDVNSAESFRKNHVPGAIHYGSHKQDFATLLPSQKDALVVSYCGGPSCAAWKSAAEKACELGYTNIKHFKGGISGWVKKG